MFRNLLKSMYSDIFTALGDGDEELFIYYLERNKKNINKLLSCGMSLLFYSFVRKKYKFGFLLLDIYKANPNFLFYENNISKPIPLLQYVLKHKNIAFAKLLLYYGADATPISTYPEYVDELEKAAALYENQLAPYKDGSDIEAYQSLARTWQEISASEKNLALQQCYKDKAQTYADKINKIDSNACEKENFIYKVKIKKI